jgi:hypothetical protein
VRRRALARLAGLLGIWNVLVDIPSATAGRMGFEWILDGQFLLQRSAIAEPNFPEGIAVIPRPRRWWIHAALLRRAAASAAT